MNDIQARILAFENYWTIHNILIWYIITVENVNLVFLLMGSLNIIQQYSA